MASRMRARAAWMSVSWTSEPIFARPEANPRQGKIGPQRMVWPAYWGRMAGEKITPLLPDTVAKAAAKALPKAPKPGEPVAPPAAADGLTQREREVALLVADGLRSREVAERLGIASQTVKSHLKTIFDKLGVRNRVELARRLVQH